MTSDDARPPSELPDPRSLTREHFDHVARVTTRWTDNDMYGHLNNAVYYELFDTAINAWVISASGVDVTSLPELGVVAESGCRFFAELEFPHPVDVAVRVERVGRSSVTYSLGLFDSRSSMVAALGHWVHVYIDRTTRGTVPVPAAVREALARAQEARA
ncbi:acyl-CoA thioesterase [Oryzobacter sp. R7]|uniref:acyl-CoA thioesterase n=1 Tax=Oryzobacter faecalis TaxID=3388656 RepID=UPI00398CE826